MIKPSRSDQYNAFIDFVGTEIQQQRVKINRRMFNVLLWCFIFPALFLGLAIVLISFGIIPSKVRFFSEWIILLFPLSYSIYFLGSEGLSQVTSGLRRGGISSALDSMLSQNEWRERTCRSLASRMNVSDPSDWIWITESFREDLRGMRNRNWTLTVLAGAVFFFILQGFELLDDQTIFPGHLTGDSFLLILARMGDKVSEMVGLAIFLILLHLSGRETQFSLERFLKCAEIVSANPEKYR